MPTVHCFITAMEHANSFVIVILAIAGLNYNLMLFLYKHKCTLSDYHLKIRYVIYFQPQMFYYTYEYYYIEKGDQVPFVYLSMLVVIK